MRIRFQGKHHSFLAYDIALGDRWRRAVSQQPRFVDMFYLVPMGEDEVHYVKLEDIDEPLLIFDREAADFLALLDGNRSFNQAFQAHLDKYPAAIRAEAHQLVDRLDALDLILDGSNASPTVEFDPDYLARQERQVRFFAHFETVDADRWEYQRRIRDARVLVLGGGGTGSQALLHLAATGFTDITVVDFDAVEASNLNRQLIYLHEDIGIPKVTAAMKRITAFNPYVRLTGIKERLDDGDRIAALMKGADICLCCADVPPQWLRHIINGAAIDTGTPVIYGGIYADHVNVGPLVVPGVSGCYHCWNEAQAQRNPNYRDYLDHILRTERQTGKSAANVWLYGTTGPGIAMGMGGIVLDVVRFISRMAAPQTLGRQFKINLCNFTVDVLEWPRIASCPACGTHRCASF